MLPLTAADADALTAAAQAIDHPTTAAARLVDACGLSAHYLVASLEWVASVLALAWTSDMDLIRHQLLTSAGGGTAPLTPREDAQRAPRLHQQRETADPSRPPWMIDT